MKTNKLAFFLLCSCFLQCCYRVPNKIEPKITYSIQEDFLNKMPFFPPFSKEEQTQDWAKEYLIATALLKNLDLYQAISTYKRAKILLPSHLLQRKQEIDYYILFCYFLGKKYQEVIETFEKSSLPKVDKSFLAFSNLLIMLYESYAEIKDEKQQKKVQKVISNSFPELSQKLTISTALLNADFQKIKSFQNPTFDAFLSSYQAKKKSIPQAQLFNALLPGSGYFYLGQKKSALTAFLLNGLFIWGSYEFFKRGYIAAGIITISFETGWYFGCIYGAGESAKFYNERIYEREVKKLMKDQKLFPIFMLNYAF